MITTTYLAFSILDLRVSKDAPQREVTLHSTFGKNAKGLEQLSACTLRWCSRQGTVVGNTPGAVPRIVQSERLASL